MKKSILYLGLIITILGCVQPSNEQKVNLTLNVSKIKEKIETVSVRGEGKPLSWGDDLFLDTIIKDSLYKITFTTISGYKFAEIKFLINGEFELEDKPSRKVFFNENNVTEYKATFNEQNL